MKIKMITITDSQLESAAMKLWISTHHCFNSQGEFGSEWKDQPRIIKNNYYKQVKVVLKAIFGEVNAT